jgi:peptidoglycan/LPS O-acetylase OafA/YrhL
MSGTHPPGTHAPGTQSHRLEQLDGLRAVAAILVIAFHYTARYQDKFGFIGAAPWRIDLGIAGVQLFFIISGFVIFMSADRARRPMDFVIARVSRLYPTFWAAVLLTWLAMALVPSPMARVSPGELLANFTMVHGLWGVPSVDGVYWSLEVEMIFYAWILLFFAAGTVRRSEPVLVGWLFLSALTTLADLNGWGRVPDLVRHLLLLQWIPWFALGMLAFRAHQLGMATQQQLFAGLLAIVTIELQRGAETALFAVMATLAVRQAALGRLPILAWRPLVAIGVLSYPLYLCHQHIGWLVIHTTQRLLGWHALASIALALLISLLIAHLLHRHIEGPMSQALRQRLQTWIDPKPAAVPAQRIGT